MKKEDVNNHSDIYYAFIAIVAFSALSLVMIGSAYIVKSDAGDYMAKCAESNNCCESSVNNCPIN